MSEGRRRRGLGELVGVVRDRMRLVIRIRIVRIGMLMVVAMTVVNVIERSVGMGVRPRPTGQDVIVPSEVQRNEDHLEHERQADDRRNDRLSRPPACPV